MSNRPSTSKSPTLVRIIALLLFALSRSRFSLLRSLNSASHRIFFECRRTTAIFIGCIITMEYRLAGYLMTLTNLYDCLNLVLGSSDTLTSISSFMGLSLIQTLLNTNFFKNNHFSFKLGTQIDLHEDNMSTNFQPSTSTH